MSHIVNPYIAGSPITGSEMFFDREDVFDFIRGTLIGKHRDNVIVLYGQRRTGKTSVLYQLRSRLDARYLCVLIDLHGFAIESLGGFLWELANHIVRVLRRDYQINLQRPNHVDFMVDPRSFFESEFLNQMWSAIGDQHLLLMVDEAVRLLEQVQAGKLEHEIFAYIRHLMQHYERLNFLFSLGSGLEEMEKEYAFLFNVGLYKKISFLDQGATNDLITQPVKDYYQIEPAARERIIYVTSGHPYYTQLLCHSLFNYWQQHPGSDITIREVDEVLEEVVERGLAVLKHVWEESTPREKAIMVSMVVTMDNSNRPVKANEIQHTWKRYSVFIPQGEIAKAIRNLVARDVLTGQDKYMFTVDLQRSWIQKYRRIEWVKEEIADAVGTWSLSKKPLLWPYDLQFKVILLIGLIFVLLVGTFWSFNSWRSSLIAATAQANATATVLASFRANATSAAATATDFAMNSYPSINSYPPENVKLVISDSLSQNSNNYNWIVYSDNNGRCVFTGDGYHAFTSTGAYYYPCTAQSIDVYNFAFEVMMKIIKGDCGGILFRVDSTLNNFYYFRVCRDGTYALFLYGKNIGPNAGILINPHSASAINAGLNRSNLVAVVDRGYTLDLFANHQKLLSIDDDTYSHGTVGVTADGFLTNTPTEVVYSNAKLWEL